MLKFRQKIDQIIQLDAEMSEIKDLDLLLGKILTVSRQFVDADAGSIYIIENGKLRFQTAQNDTLQKKLPKGKKLLFTSFTVPINTESIVGYVAATGESLNIKDVYHIPGKATYSFDKSYDEKSGYLTQSMLTLPLKTYNGKIIGAIQLINARDNTANSIASFKKKDVPLIEHLSKTATTAIERAQLNRAIILRMIKMAELRDPKETGAHVNRVASYAVEVYNRWAVNIGLPQDSIEKNLDKLKYAAMLHDAGKIAISDAILKKPARLTDDEMTIMKTHTIHGARLFLDGGSDYDDAAMTVAIDHHERWDGRGYPGHINIETGKPLPGYEDENGLAVGKKGDEIHPFGRVVALCDVYDALSSKRAYKNAWTEEDVLSELTKEAGGQFDPDMVAAFMEDIDVIRNITAKYPDAKE